MNEKLDQSKKLRGWVLEDRAKEYRKSLASTCLGLVYGYFTFLAAVVVVGVCKLLQESPEYDLLAVLFATWLFLFIPIVLGGWLLALVVVWPISHLLSGCGATRMVYQVTHYTTFFKT